MKRGTLSSTGAGGSRDPRCREGCNGPVHGVRSEWRHCVNFAENEETRYLLSLRTEDLKVKDLRRAVAQA